MAKHPEHPPGAHRRHAAAIGVIDNDVVVVTDSKPAHHICKNIGARHHVRQIDVWVGYFVHVEKAGAGNVSVVKLSDWIALGGGQMEAGIYDTHLAIAETVGKPAAFDQNIGVGVIHDCWLLHPIGIG